MLPKQFKPKHEYDLIRIGGNNDGGYIVEKNSIKNSKSLLTLGLGYEWRFEKEYYTLFKNPIICFDHSVNYSSVKKLSRKYFLSYLFRIFKPKYFLKRNFFKDLLNNILLFRDYKKFFNNNVIHEKIRIGNGKEESNLTTVLKHKNLNFPCFLKVDIEGSEYRILNEILENQTYFTGIIIEFHNVDLHFPLILNFISNLKFELVHIHPQNPAPVTKDEIPTQIELTFAKSPVIKNVNPKIPHDLDMPANPNFKEIKLIFDEN